MPVLRAGTVAIQGAGVSGTGCGKSLIVAILCRLFAEDGYGVAPFKALNLTNVTYVDGDGREYGYSQVLQAVAAGVKPDYRMNPFTLKPLGGGAFDIILEGRIVERNVKPLRMILAFIGEDLRRIVGAETLYDRVIKSIKRCLDFLLDNYDIVCIEGSDPSKLRGLGFLSRLIDIPNMITVKMASAPVILLAGSIDSAIATYNYLDDERKFIRGVLLNRFNYYSLEREIVEGMGVPRRLFEIGIKRIEEDWLKRFNINLEVIGSIPYLEELSSLPDLDPLVSEERVNLDVWRRLMPGLAEKVRKNIDLNKIYKIMGI